MRLSHMMVFRFSFFSGFLVDGSLFLLQLIMFQLIYGQVDTIGGWNRGQMLLFIGTFSLLNAINMVLYFFGVQGIPDKITQGSLDQYLTKPFNPLLRLSFEKIDIGCVPLVFFSILIILYGVSVTGQMITAGSIFLYILFVFLMAVLYYDMEVILRTIPFFFIRANSIMRLEDSMLSLNMRLPGIIYKGFFKLLFYLFLPYGIMSTVPVQILTNTLSPVGILYAGILVPLFTAFTFWFWKFGLRHYQSASS